MFEEMLNQLVRKAEGTLRGKQTFTDENGIRHCCVCGEPLEKVIENGGLLSGQKVVCVCRCDAEKEEKERAERELIQRRDRVRQMLRDSPLYDPAYAKYTFALDRYADDPSQNPASQRCRDYVAHFEELRREGIGMLLAGPVGTGKSFYAAATVNALCEQGVSAITVSTARLMNALKATRATQEVLDDLNRFSLVALDDLGAERDTAFAIEQLEAFVDQRTLCGRPLIVTTNLPIQSILRPKDLCYTRLFDRIRALCSVVVPLLSESRRADQAKARLAKCREIMGY